MPRLTHTINIIARCGNLYRRERLADLGLSPSQIAIVAKVCHVPGLSQEQIARAVYLDKSNVARHLARLEREGWLRRAPDEHDRRLSRVYPTEAAEGLYPRIRALRRDWYTYLTEGLTDDELALAETLLGRIMARAIDCAGGPTDGEE